MQQINNEPLEKYILIDSSLKPSYSYAGYSHLTKSEVKIKNYAYKINRSKYKYIKKEDWK